MDRLGYIGVVDEPQTSTLMFKQGEYWCRLSVVLEKEKIEQPKEEQSTPKRKSKKEGTGSPIITSDEEYIPHP